MNDEMQAELREHIQHAVWSAIDQLLERDHFLLRADANERSITHRLALYLEDEFTEWNVDCEYNRDGHEPKELYFPLEDVDPSDTNATTVYPDIIVHKRGEQDNLLVIEVKKTNSRLGAHKDEQKLREYQRQLGYQYALFIEFSVTRITQECLTSVGLNANRQARR